jgi:hypothetical protein
VAKAHQTEEHLLREYEMGKALKSLMLLIETPK